VRHCWPRWETQANKRIGRARPIALLFVVLLLVAACGGSEEPDPFVGTWHFPGDGTFAVIAKVAGQYRVTLPIGGPLEHSERRGDRLHAWTELLSPDGEPTGVRVIEVVLTYDAASDSLIYTDPSASQLRVEVARESTSTQIPSPWPTASTQ
jgi:hypothetical protein